MNETRQEKRLKEIVVYLRLRPCGMFHEAFFKRPPPKKKGLENWGVAGAGYHHPVHLSTFCIWEFSKKAPARRSEV